MTTNEDRHVLAVEAAIGSGSLALFRGNDLVEQVSGEAGVSRATDILPAIDSLLKGCDTQARALSCIVVGAGPGSFTGIRIAISTAIGLAAPFAIPVKLVSTLEAIALIAPGDEPAAALPLGRERFCVQYFSRRDDMLYDVAAPEALFEDEFRARVITAKPRQFVVHHSIFTSLYHEYGESLIDCGEDLAAHLGKGFINGKVNGLDTPLFVGKQR